MLPTNGRPFTVASSSDDSVVWQREMYSDRTMKTANAMSHE